MASSDGVPRRRCYYCTAEVLLPLGPLDAMNRPTLLADNEPVECRQCRLRRLETMSLVA